MEQTLGKRISTNRKRLGLTQDQLAEQLGVTAQAVSKWENDQSCPDIATLPRLAEIFGITTDELLGYETAQKVHEAEVVEEENDQQESEGVHLQKGNWEFRWDSGKKNALGFAGWVLSVGILYFCAKWYQWDVSLWDVLWPSALTIFGLLGIFPRFSFFRLGCTVFGSYFLIEKLAPIELPIGGELIIPVILILWGLSLLADALRKKHRKGMRIYHNGRKIGSKASKHGSSSFTNTADSFHCEGSFSGEDHQVVLDKLAHGSAEISFGELVIDLSGVNSVSDNCVINADCSFGELVLKVPSRFAVDVNKSTAFATVSTQGQPESPCEGIIHLNADVSFGEVTIRYI